MNTFYIVRHGETDWNVLGKTQGHGNSKLTEEGLNQAKSLAKYLKDIDMIFCSDLQRAIDTATIISEELNIKVNKDDRLREMNFGKWEGLLIDEIKKDYLNSYKSWRDTPHLAEIENGETLHIIKERTDNFIKEINEKYQNKNILIVSHSITIRVMLLSFLNSSVENIYRVKQENTALNIIEFKNYGPVIKKLNDISHLTNTQDLIKNALD